MTTNYDTIIIGAGLGGLAAAAQLAQGGDRTLVLERNSVLGGRARTDNLDGWLFNHGAHALYRNGIGHRILQGLGVEPAGEPAPLAGAQLMLDGKTTHLPASPKGLALTNALSPRGKVQFAKLMSKLPKLNPNDFAAVTVDDWLAEYRPDVQAVAKAVVRLSTYAAATDVMSADTAIIQLTGAEDGVLYLHDGWAALIAQLEAAATLAGATITASSAVDSVERQGSGFAVSSGDHTYTAATVIVAAGGPSLTARLLGVEQDIFGKVGPAPEAATLDLALDALPSKHRFVLGVDEPTYFSVHSPPARLAPDQAVAAVAMRYISPNDDGSADAHRDSLERIAVAAGCGTPIRSRFLRRLPVTNGLPTADAGGIAGRPASAVPNMPGAFIAGDWVGPRGLLADAAIASGYDAAIAATRAIRATASAH